MASGNSHGQDSGGPLSPDWFDKLLETEQAPSEMGVSQENEDHQPFSPETERILNDLLALPNPPSVNSTEYSDASTTVDSQQSNPQPERIVIKSQPRTIHHPRMESEWPRHKDIIQSESEDEGVKSFPSIFVFSKWQECRENIIEVTLMDTIGGDKSRPHPYPIRNMDETASTVSLNTQQTPGALYFPVTPDEFEKGSKSFKIAIVKKKQGEGGITKQLIAERQLSISKLRFQRFYLATDGSYYPEQGSTSYTGTMEEKSGSIAIHHISPEFGPMNGGRLLDIVCTGSNNAPRTQLSITVSVEEFAWIHEVKDFNFTGGTIHFPMPALPYYLQTDQLAAKVSLFDANEQVGEATYVYDARVDEILKSFGTLNLKSSNACTNGLDESDMSSSSSTVAAAASSRIKRRRT